MTRRRTAGRGAVGYAPYTPAAPFVAAAGRGRGRPLVARSDGRACARAALTRLARATPASWARLPKALAACWPMVAATRSGVRRWPDWACRASDVPVLAAMRGSARSPARAGLRRSILPTAPIPFLNSGRTAGNAPARRGRNSSRSGSISPRSLSGISWRWPSSPLPPKSPLSRGPARLAMAPMNWSTSGSLGDSRPSPPSSSSRPGLRDRRRARRGCSRSWYHSRSRPVRAEAVGRAARRCSPRWGRQSPLRRRVPPVVPGT